MPQRAPHRTSDNEYDSLDYGESDSGSAAGGPRISLTSRQSSVSNTRQRPQQHGDMEIIRRLQLENQMLKNDNCTLGEKNKTLSSNQRRCSNTHVPDELKAFDAELATFSRKYGIVVEMFPPMHHVLKLPVPNPPPTILSGSRYASKSAEELCLITELYSLLPGHLHRFVPTTHFQSLLEHHLQGGRSSEIGKLRVMAGQIQKMLGHSPSSKFPSILFMRQEMDPTMSTVFGNWEPLAKAIRIVMFGKNSLDIIGWPRAKCNARKWGTTSCTPGLLAWGWVALIFILSTDTSFTKDGVGVKSQLPYAAMFTAYKQLWVTLWDEPRIISIRQKIDSHVWQSSSTTNVATSDAEGEDFTSDLMCLALANAGRKDSDVLTTNDDFAPPITHSSPTMFLAGPAVPPTVRAPLPTAPAPLPTSPVPLPAAPAPLPAAPAETIITLVSAVTSTTLRLLPAVTPAVTVTMATEFPPIVPAAVAIPASHLGITAVPSIPSNGEALPQAIASQSSSGRRGRGKKAGVLTPISSSVDPDALTEGQQHGRWATRSRKQK
ncbi:uncharacterized protein EDB91DRAFT_1245087 [Suillus paluster]|uniref:uncharacterized protein n=1 Tax=Suillus paluster TaxID=48578 RepID=UPI001B869BCB|nr:uncharacterized protein EDB91DRAFT_1245087 [Suillus paluster]KAG1748381.1 hypothetical protein EDB91DRAFT_1245087 [Suillus paluster]